jgi:putative multiple sugar transport system substrate-binding protein
LPERKVTMFNGPYTHRFSSIAVGLLLIIFVMPLASYASSLPVADTNALTNNFLDVIQVGVVLPTQDGRWEQDGALIQNALTTDGYTSQVLFSQGNSLTEKTNVETLITLGIEVLIFCPHDATVAAVAAEEAKAAGVKVISFERLILDTHAVDFFVTFDSISVGEAQAQYLVNEASGIGNPLYLYAGAPTDNNSFLFFEGAWNILQPKIADGTFIIKNSSEAVALQNKAILTRSEIGDIIDQITTNWDYGTAAALAQANLAAVSATDKGNVFILGPNDNTARAIADVFAADFDVLSYIITGQDAEQASVQYIIDGKQSMTVFKDPRTISEESAAAAITYLQGGTPDASTTVNNGAIDVPSKLIAPIVVDKNNIIPVLIDSGYYKFDDFTWPSVYLPLIRR